MIQRPTGPRTRRVTVALTVATVGLFAVGMLGRDERVPPRRLWVRNFESGPGTPEWSSIVERVGSTRVRVWERRLRASPVEPLEGWQVGGGQGSAVAIVSVPSRLESWLGRLGIEARARPYRLVAPGRSDPDAPPEDEWAEFVCEQDSLPTEGAADPFWAGEWAVESVLPHAGVLEDLENPGRARSDAERWQRGSLTLHAGGSAGHTEFPGTRRAWTSHSGVLYLESFVPGSAAVTVAVPDRDGHLRFPGRVRARRVE